MAEREQMSIGELTNRQIKNESGNYTFSSGATVPNAVAGYAKGCIFIDTDKAGSCVYFNTGDETSCTFTLVGTVGALSITDAELAADSVITSKILDANVTPPKTIVSAARTATADGTTTGTIAANTTFVTVTCDQADKIIILPAPVVGQVITLINGATGYELRSSTPASIGINGGTGAAAESAIGASKIVRMTCVSATNWIGEEFTAAGVNTAVEVAA